MNTKVVILGQTGFIGNGITLGIVGALMIITAIDGKTGAPGIETVLRLLNLSPAGGVLLVLKAVGSALFGVYCCAWAANRRRQPARFFSFGPARQSSTRRRDSRGRQGDDELSPGVAVHHPLDRRRSLAERVRPVNHRNDLAGFGQFGQNDEVRSVLRREHRP